MAKLNKEDFISALKEMTILEVKELVDAMKDVYKRQVHKIHSYQQLKCLPQLLCIFDLIIH